MHLDLASWQEVAVADIRLSAFAKRVCRQFEATPPPAAIQWEQPPMNQQTLVRKLATYLTADTWDAMLDLGEGVAPLNDQAFRYRLKTVERMSVRHVPVSVLTHPAVRAPPVGVLVTQNQQGISKKPLCTLFISADGCDRGGKCRFSHDGGGNFIQKRVNNKPLCTLFVSADGCNRGAKCRFSHDDGGRSDNCEQRRIQKRPSNGQLSPHRQQKMQR
jgi:hypothetical protein